MTITTTIDSSNLPSFTVLTDTELQAMRSKLLDAGGDYAKAGLSLQDIRNAIYTKALRVNPNVEADDAAKPHKAKKAKAETTRGPTLTGDSMNDLLG